MPAETLREYVGLYPLRPNFLLTVTEEVGSLHAQATGQPKIPVFAFAPDKFFSKDVDAQLTFTRNAGQVTGIILHQDGLDQAAKKTLCRPPTQAAVRRGPAAICYMLG